MVIKLIKNAHIQIIISQEYKLKKLSFNIQIFLSLLSKQMKTKKRNSILYFLSIVLIISVNSQACNVTSITSICKCNSYQLNANGLCQTCAVPNCQLCSIDSSNECDVCKKGYVLDQLTKKTCVKAEPSQLVCTSKSCSCSPYEVNFNGLCQTCAVPNCQLCSIDSSNECDVCKKGYVLDQLTKKTCVKAEPSQLVCTSKSCSCSPFQINVDGACVSCAVNNCLLCAYNNPKQCDLCKSGFVPDELTGQTCVPRTNSSTVCTSKSCACSPYQVSINGSCQACSVSNCLLCSIDSISECDICKPGYVLDQLTKSICVSKASSSLSCTEKSCKCGPYQINKNGTCVSCQAKNCLLCSIDDVSDCDVCEYSYIYNMSTKKCEHPQCSGGQVWNGSECVCSDGTYKDSTGICIKCANNCMKCISESVCTQCITQYFVEQDQCSPCISRCVSCTNSTSCSFCKLGYYYDAGKNKCRKLPQGLLSVGWLNINGIRRRVSCPGGCASCSSFSQCSSCQSGHYLKGQKCHSCSGNCKQCKADSPSTCISCAVGYALARNKCVKCTDSNCLVCVESPDYCVSCGNGYYLSQSQGTCLSCGSYCASCTAEGKCASCTQPYALIDGYCVECVTGCSICNPANISDCLKCGTGFYNNSGTCTVCASGCSQCSNSSACTQCMPGYMLIQGICSISCTLPCLECTGLTTSKPACSQCLAGYTLNETTKSCDKDLSCNTNSTCVACPYQYVLVNSKCVPCQNTDAKCITCAADLTTCSICKAGYYLGSGDVCQLCASGCAQCQSLQTCTSCSDGYYMLIDEQSQSLGICSACSQNSKCATCQSSSVCLSCKGDYYLKGSKCISRKNIGLRMVMLYNFSAFMPKLRGFKLGLLKLLGANFEGKDYLISIDSLKQGSVIIDSQITIPDGTNPSDVLNSLTSNLSAGTVIDGIKLQQNPELTANGFVADQAQNWNTSNLGLALGLGIPLTLIVIVIIIVIKIKIERQRKYQEETPKNKAPDSTVEKFKATPEQI